MGAAQIVYNQARDIESYNQYISPVLIRFASDVSAAFGRQWTATVLADTTITNYTRSPQALSPAIGFSIFNLRPFDPPVAIPAVSIGLIYLIIIAFFSFGFFLPTHMLFVLPNPTSPHPPLKFIQLIIYRYVATITAYFFLSFCYSLVSLVFLIPMNNTPPAPFDYYTEEDPFNNANPLGHATFVVYWLLNFFGMASLGLACENVAMLIGAPWTALWLIVSYYLAHCQRKPCRCSLDTFCIKCTSTSQSPRSTRMIFVPSGQPLHCLLPLYQPQTNISSSSG